MTDIKLNDSYEMALQNGDFAISESDQRHVEHLLISRQGEWKETPILGGNIPLSRGGQISRSLDRHIRIQLEADGFKTELLQIQPEGINLTGSY